MTKSIFLKFAKQKRRIDVTETSTKKIEKARMCRECIRAHGIGSMDRDCQNVMVCLCVRLIRSDASLGPVENRHPGS